jgi:HupE / UreJ protein
MKPVKFLAFKRFFAALITAVKISCVVLGLCAPALAHKASDAYLQLGADDSQTAPSSNAAPRIGLKLSLALRDLDAAIDTLDVDNNRQLEWGEIRQNMPAIQSWVAQGLQMRCANDSLSLAWAFESLEQRSDGVYVRLASFITCSQAELGVRYQLMQHIDATHRLIIGGTLLGTSVAALASPHNKPDVILQLPLGSALSTSAQSGWSAFAQFFPEGVHHLATGYDHLAFLLALLLPIMLRQSPSLKPDAASTAAFSAQPGRPGVWDLMRTVTGFTLGHSVTLFLASMGWIASPAWVEPAIAVTIGLSALLNLYPVRWVRSDALALGFGLVHGLGFSSIMREANVSGSLLPWALAGFNLGVEAGQLAGVALWCGVHLVLVRWQRYEQVVVRGGSWALLALAIYWAVQRLALG